MRVLHIITGLATGGAEMMLFKLLERLDRERYRPMVISLTTMGDIGPRIAALGISVQAMGMTSGLPSPSDFLRLVRQVRQLQPDIVHTWLYHADLLGGLAARLAGVTAVCWGVRSSNLDPDKTSWTTRAVRRLCALLSPVIPQRILVNSDTARQIHVALGYSAEKIEVVPNGFDLSRFKPDERARDRLRAELRLPGEALLVGMIARFDPLKNHFGFISAMAAVCKNIGHVRLIMAGKDVDWNNDVLVQAIRAAGLQENVCLLGLRDDIPEVMAALDILACPSHAEAFPNVVGEAMACGVPCVATDVGDCAYIIGDTGRVVPVGDMDAFGVTTEMLLRLPREQREVLGTRARQRIASMFGIGSVVLRYEKTYEYMRTGTR